MKNSFSFLLFIFVLQYSFAQSTLRIELRNQPASHINDSIYIAGSFNGWQPGLIPFYFRKNEQGILYTEINQLQKGVFEFKITRGTWEKVECDKKGGSIQNRIININNDTTIYLSVEAWNDDFPKRPPVSTKTKQVFIIDSAFNIPQLNRQRRIWIYLPENYFFEKKRYPVLYMHDGQNLFDERTSSYGEWGVDEMMDSINPGRRCIIVGIDHGNSKRLTEYNPFDSRFGKGEGGAYVEFLVKTLKPFIDKHYRTKPLSANTSIAGSSMGGLISMYAAIKHPEVFGNAGIVSPSFWISPSLSKTIDSSVNIQQTRFYFLCGEKESTEMVADMKKIYDQLKLKGVKNMQFKTVSDGTHNEAFWRREMYELYRWLNRN